MAVISCFYAAERGAAGTLALQDLACSWEALGVSGRCSLCSRLTLVSSSHAFCVSQAGILTPHLWLRKAGSGPQVAVPESPEPVDVLDSVAGGLRLEMKLGPRTDGLEMRGDPASGWPSILTRVLVSGRRKTGGMAA